MIVEASAAARQVAVRTSQKFMRAGRPSIVPDSTAGCTKTMYDIVRNVVTPAMKSWHGVVPFFRRLNQRSNLPAVPLEGSRSPGSVPEDRS